MHLLIWSCFLLAGACCLPQTSQGGSANGGISPDCRTARGESGACVGRERCDYGPSNIDHTLYAPRAYRRPCSEKEVCCPRPNIIQENEAKEDSLQE